MVARVYGVANGAEILFHSAEGDRWTAAVPWRDDGEYVAEIFAEDEAGNSAYLCSMLFVISGHKLQGYIVPRGYQGGADTIDYTGLVTIGEYFGELRKGGFTVEHRVCGRDIH